MSDNYKKNIKEIKTVMTMHTLHCGGTCMLKLHMDDGRISKITSAGDIQREGSFDKDESLLPLQKRACLMGLCEMKRVYAPDRLKYPLKQTLERGNIRGFKRISWDEALDTVTKWYREMQKRKDELGYLPVWDEGGITPNIGPCLKRFGSYSFGNISAAMFGAIGRFNTTRGNPAIDILRSKYIIIWACNIAATIPNLPFIMMKAKEAGIPITVVEVRGTDTAFAMATGKGKVPGLITLHPGTDSVLLAAMANVIYRKKLHDVSFLKEYCFGFFPEDTVISKSLKKHPITGESYAGKTFTVPQGQSFIEYLDKLEEENRGYAGVLSWAEKLTGIPSQVIEDFAVEYSTTKPSFIFSRFNGGAQRTQNGMYFSWMIIAITSMTGNTNKRGGGYGDISVDDGYKVKLGNRPEGSYDKSGVVPFNPTRSIMFSVFKDSDVILNGLDGRTHEQLRGDVLKMNNIDLGPKAKLTVEMYVRGAICSNTFNQTQNINKRLLAWNKLKHTVGYERFMTATAAMCDIVLPTITTFEESFFGFSSYSDTFVNNGPLKGLYESKPDWWINEQLAIRLGIDYSIKSMGDKKIMEKQWEGASIPEEYKKINPNIKLPGFDEIIEKGSFKLPVPLDKTFIFLENIKPGEYDTDTGMINFYSPYFAERGRMVLGVAKAQHVMAQESFEDVLERGGKIGAKGIKYPLQLFTPHVPNRAHTTYDNVPILKEQNPHAAEIHHIEAEKRGIVDGQTVYIYSDCGCLKIPVRVTRRIAPGTIAIGEGAWYRPSTNETYEAWFDSNYDGVCEKHVVPVDVGGCPNTITPDLNSGVLDPFIDGLGMNAGGSFCEISSIKPT